MRLDARPGWARSCALAAAVPSYAAGAREAPAQFTDTVRRATDSLFPKTVYIKVVYESYERGEKKRVESSGSGVIISSDGYVVTNHHVVEAAHSVRCLLRDKINYDADIVGKDADSDLALLKLRLPPGRKPLPFARFGDSRALAPGDFVMAIGCPFGLTRSVSLGIVNNPAQYLGPWEYKWIQTDASINPGNSGGPLVDVRGEVVGINSRVFEGAGLGFAIPSELVAEVVRQLKAQGRVARSVSGIQFQALKDFDQNTYFDGDRGVLVGGLDPESPALKAGLREGDLILEVGGRRVDGLYVEDLPAVRRLFSWLPAGRPVLIRLRRAGAPGRAGTISLELVPGPKKTGQADEGKLEFPEWMLTVKEIRQFDDPFYYYYRKRGCYVLGVKDGGNAERSGFENDDILLDIDGRPVESLDDARAAYARGLERPVGRRKLLFSLLRRGLPLQLALDYNRTQASHEEEK